MNDEICVSSYGCTCNWQIPGVDKLPWHRHNIIWEIKRKYDGKIFNVFALEFVGSPDYQVLSREGIITIDVNWKVVAYQFMKEINAENNS